MITQFKNSHPVTDLIFFISVITAGMLFRHPATLAVCFAAALSCYIGLCGRAAVKFFLTFLLPMLAVVVIINGVFAHYGTTPLFTLPDGNNLTLEAVVYGFVLGLSSVTAILWFLCCGEIVTADKFMFLFGKLLPAAALVVSMALRFIPMYKNRLRVISEAQRGIGKDPGSGSVTRRLDSGGKILSVLVTWSLENAVDTSDAMRARGYGLTGRKSYGRYRLTVRDIALSVFMLLIDGSLIAGYIKKTLYCVYDPYIMINPALSGEAYYSDRLNITLNSMTPAGIMTAAAFTLLCLLPLIICVMENLKWNRSRSRL